MTEPADLLASFRTILTEEMAKPKKYQRQPLVLAALLAQVADAHYAELVTENIVRLLLGSDFASAGHSHYLPAGPV